MPEEMGLWLIEDGRRLKEVPRGHLNLESRIEEWLAEDISVLDREVLVIGRQVLTEFGGLIDLLCIDRVGDLVVVELKRDKTPREITAQVLDYGSWVADLSGERIEEIAREFLGQDSLEDAFRRQFGVDLPETLNQSHRLMIVASEIDSSSERIIQYLSGTYGVSINAATFQYFRTEDGQELLGRVFLIEPEQVDSNRRCSKRRPSLKYEDLDRMAQEKGVGDLYQLAVNRLRRLFQARTTVSSIAFTGDLDGSKKTVVSLIPKESDATNGLRFQAYSLRLCKLLGLSKDQVEALLPTQHEPWVYPTASAGDDWEGFQGFFADAAEVQRFTDGLSEASAGGGWEGARTGT